MYDLSISPWEWFLGAGAVGKGVIGLLLALSIWCWALIVEGAFALTKLKRALRTTRGDEVLPVLRPVLAAGEDAAATCSESEAKGDARARVEQAMNRGGRALLRRLEGGLPNLAIISSIAPFIGLFGTVWGIMTSFAGIAQAQDTSLAVVAPGISEALATTAFGLAAAIPASVGYSRLGAALGRAASELGDWIEVRGPELLAASLASRSKETA